MVCAVHLMPHEYTDSGMHLQLNLELGWLQCFNAHYTGNGFAIAKILQVLVTFVSKVVQTAHHPIQKELVFWSSNSNKLDSTPTHLQ